jgi:hypothetical protein
MQDNKDTIEFAERILSLVTDIDDYKSPYAKAVGDPSAIVEVITEDACYKTFAISAGLSIPPGFLGILSILPELFMIYRIQARLVKDIATLYGKEASLSAELLFYCLFKQTGIHILRNFIQETGAKILIRPSTLRMMEKLAEKIGFEVTRSTLKKSIFRFLPFVGAIFSGGLSYYDTKKIGESSSALFSKEILLISREEETLPE